MTFGSVSRMWRSRTRWASELLAFIAAAYDAAGSQFSPRSTADACTRCICAIANTPIKSARTATTRNPPMSFLPTVSLTKLPFYMLG
ncbi:hypothetical protein D3C72_1847140 [compost metagenome]